MRATARPVSLGMADDRYFCFAAGFGFDAAIVHGVERKRRQGKRSTHVLYTRVGARELFRADRRHPTIRVELEDGTLLSDVFFTVVSNADPWTYVGNRPAAPDTRGHLRVPASGSTRDAAWASPACCSAWPGCPDRIRGSASAVPSCATICEQPHRPVRRCAAATGRRRRPRAVREDNVSLGRCGGERDHRQARTSSIPADAQAPRSTGLRTSPWTRPRAVGPVTSVRTPGARMRRSHGGTKPTERPRRSVPESGRNRTCNPHEPLVKRPLCARAQRICLKHVRELVKGFTSVGR